MPHNILQSKLTNKCSMMKLKSSTRKRLLKFLSKIFWHFNQSVPDYSTTTTTTRRSKKKYEQQQQSNANFNIYPKRYRTSHRTSTLMSIQEENELESDEL